MIWKYRLDITDVQKILMPRGARLLCVQTQDEDPKLWAEVDPKMAREERTILTVGTGNPIPWRLGAYLGTYQLQQGRLVFHVFEMGWGETPQAQTANRSGQHPTDPEEKGLSK